MTDSKSTINRDSLIESSGTKKRNLSAKEALIVQEPFLSALKKKMDRDGINGPQLAKKLGVPYSYIVALASGNRMVANSERIRVEKFADYLEVPIIQIYIWGGLLAPKDFIIRKGLDKTLDGIFSIMENDPALTAIIPTAREWNDTKQFSERAKLFAAQLFELYTNKMMLEQASLEAPKKKTAPAKHVLSRD